MSPFIELFHYVPHSFTICFQVKKQEHLCRSYEQQHSSGSLF